MYKFCNFSCLGKNYRLETGSNGFIQKKSSIPVRTVFPRIPEHEKHRALRSSAIFNNIEFQPGKFLREFFAITDCGGRSNKTRTAPIMPADSSQPPDYVRNMAAKNPAVGMEFIQNDKFQAAEKFVPR